MYLALMVVNFVKQVGREQCPSITGPILPICLTSDVIAASNLHTAVLFSLQSLCLTHTGKPTGVAVSHCMTRFQTLLIHTTCQISYHSHCSIIGALDSSEP